MKYSLIIILILFFSKIYGQDIDLIGKWEIKWNTDQEKCLTDLDSLTLIKLSQHDIIEDTISMISFETNLGFEYCDKYFQFKYNENNSFIISTECGSSCVKDYNDSYFMISEKYLYLVFFNQTVPLDITELDSLTEKEVINYYKNFGMVKYLKYRIEKVDDNNLNLFKI